MKLSTIDKPIELPAKVEPLEEFDATRQHLCVLQTGGILLLGASIAAGNNLLKLSEKVKPSHGGARAKGEKLTARPWTEISAEQTGLSKETNRRLEKVALDLNQQLKGKKGKLAKQLRDLLADTERKWTPQDYKLAADAAGQIYDAETWTDILRAIGILKPKPEPPKQIEKKEKRLSLTEQARLSALGFIDGLRSFTTDAKKWRKKLAALPVDPTGDETNPSLRELKAELEERMAEVSETIEKKLN